MRREHQQKQVLYEINDIFLDKCVVNDFYEKDPIIEQLVKIVEKLNNPNIATQEKLMQWSKKI